MFRILKYCYYKLSILCLLIYVITSFAIYTFNPYMFIISILPFIIVGFIIALMLILIKARYLPCAILITHIIRSLQLYRSWGNYLYIPYPYGDWQTDLFISVYVKQFYSSLLIFFISIGVLLEFIVWFNYKKEKVNVQFISNEVDT